VETIEYQMSGNATYRELSQQSYVLTGRHGHDDFWACETVNGLHPMASTRTFWPVPWPSRARERCYLRTSPSP